MALNHSPQRPRRAQRHCDLNFASFAFFAVKYFFDFIFQQPWRHSTDKTIEYNFPAHARHMIPADAP
jgi:hypothetical protein